ncbi:MAG TPA: endonuclease/exonuclease/phosphatase family protein [Trueperaceae bacterium]
MQLRLVTYNIKSGLYHPDGLEAVARVLEEADPDVVALQEVDRGTRRARNEDQTAWLAARLEMPYHCFGAATPWDGGGEYGVGLVSDLPLVGPKVDHLWVPHGEGVGHGAREPRVVLSATVEANGKGEALTVMVTHLGLTEEQRARQARQLLERVQEMGGRPVALAGDLNAHPDSPEVRLLAESLHDVLAHVPETERVTFPSGDPEMHGHDFLARTIDYIFVNGAAKAVEARVIADYSLASDHNPCEAVIAV